MKIESKLRQNSNQSQNYIDHHPLYSNLANIRFRFAYHTRLTTDTYDANVRQLFEVESDVVNYFQMIKQYEVFTYTFTGLMISLWSVYTISLFASVIANSTEVRKGSHEFYLIHISMTVAILALITLQSIVRNKSLDLYPIIWRLAASCNDFRMRRRLSKLSSFYHTNKQYCFCIGNFEISFLSFLKVSI